jgi:antitoxin component YwqK of YwqJK toxin-antitoxin module
MKKAIILILLISSALEISAQYRDTLLWYNGLVKKPRWIMTCEDDTKQDCQLMSYFPNGNIQGKAIVFYDRSTIRPNGDVIIYNQNGSVKQKYNHETGVLWTYYDSGEVMEKMVTPINDTIEYKYKYFKDGTLREEEVSRHEIGRQSLTYSYNRSSDNIYDNQGITYNFLKTFHGNGKLKSFVFMDTDSKVFKYIYQFYSPDGQLDTNAKYEKRHYKRAKFGRRYKYHNNGQLREIVDFENGEREGEQIWWTKSGQIIWKANNKSDRRNGKFQSWWENGQIKEVGSYIGGYKNGGFLAFNRQGKVMEYGTYLGDKVVGVATRWDTLGNLFGEGFGSKEKQFDNWYYNKRHIRDETVWLERVGNTDQNGLRNGEWTFIYYKKGKDKKRIGKTCAIANYKNGYLDGETTVYYENGNKLMIANYKNGLLYGSYISYWETGDFCRRGEFREHKKQGIWESTHYQSNKKNRIQNYVDNQAEVLQEWDVDGFMKKNTIDNKVEEQLEIYYHNKSGMYQKYVTPYGRKNSDAYVYDTSGILKETRILIFDNPQDFIWTKFYPNGNKASQGSYANRKTEGIYWTWFENGQLKSEVPYSVGKRDGESISWNENGIRQGNRSYENGIEIFNDDGEMALIPCLCNRPPKEMNISFMNWLPSYVEFEKVNKRTDFFNISEKEYKYLYARNIQMYDYSINGELTVVRDVSFKTHNNLILNLAACRRGSNRTHLSINGDYNERSNQVELRVYNFDLKIEFPYDLLHPYDFENQEEQEIEIEKFSSSGVTFKVKELLYQDGRNHRRYDTLPHIVIKQESNSTPCFPDSEIGNTGIVISADFAIPDLSMVEGVKLPNQGKAIDESKNYYLPKYSYLNRFMGVYFENATFFFTNYNLNLKAKGKHIFINGKEIIGNFEIVTNENFSLTAAKEFTDYLKSQGFKIIKSNIQDSEILRISWKFIL